MPGTKSEQSARSPVLVRRIDQVPRGDPELSDAPSDDDLVGSERA